MAKSVFERLTDRGIRFEFDGEGNGSYLFNVPNAPAAGDVGTYAEAIAYFEEILEYDKTAPGDGGEQF